MSEILIPEPKIRLKYNLISLSKAIEWGQKAIKGLVFVQN